LYVPTDILSKVTPVNEVEYEIIKNHVVESYNLLKGLPLNKRVFEIILQHHERIDGSGYPKGLKGDKLLLESRILAVADVIEAMNHDRPHRIAPGMAETQKELRENSGKLYDPLVVQTFFDLLEERDGVDQR
jgi:HD-GYP domain-containing protein (c-di-GMP phosphodiesterase class II)